MKRLILLAALAFTLSGCDIVKDLVMDKVSDPEDIVVDYVLTLADMYSNETDCDKLAQDIAVYCERRDEVVTKAVKDTLLRLENDRIDAKKRNELYDKLSQVKSIHNLQCTVHMRAITELAICTKPVLKVLASF